MNDDATLPDGVVKQAAAQSARLPLERTQSIQGCVSMPLGRGGYGGPASEAWTVAVTPGSHASCLCLVRPRGHSQIQLLAPLEQAQGQHQSANKKGAEEWRPSPGLPGPITTTLCLE